LPTIVIIDDQQLSRAGIRAMLASERNLAIVGEASSGGEGVALCGRLQPNLVLMDVVMPDMDGFAATRAIKQACPHTIVLMITMSEDPEHLVEALEAGASGYLLKDVIHHELIAAVRRTLAGESVLAPALASALLTRLAGKHTMTSAAPRPSLTPRERQVLQLLTEGRTNGEIARSLVVSLSTVKAHVEHIIAKLEASDRTQAAVRGVRLGLVTLGER